MYAVHTTTSGEVARLFPIDPRLSMKYIKNQKDSEENRSEFHEQICEKLKKCGIARLRSSLTVFDVVKGISLSAIIYEIALESISASLSTNLLGFAFAALLKFPETQETVIKVMKAAHEIGLSHSGNEPGDDDYSVSLDADTECPSDQMQKTKPLCLHEPVAFSDFHISKMDSGVQSDKRFTNFIFNKHDEPISNDSKEMTGV
ncbi:hypothetical protein FXO37_06658 [Capsicum annuum]|nr:hypothetical protein FXO37_06658 [Capsicum annuum]